MMKILTATALLLAAAGTAHADALSDAQKAIRDASGELYYKTKPPTAETLAEGDIDGDGERFVERGKACLTTVDAAIAAHGADAKVDIRGEKWTLGDGRTHCQALIDYGTALEPLIDGREEAARKALYGKYEALGVKGDRLELFAYYDGTSWYMKGCQYTVDEIEDIVKAKVLFHWLDNSDGTITIRKYTFKKNTYKVKEKTVAKLAQAYKACR
jgi:hypothetical protein